MLDFPGFKHVCAQILPGQKYLAHPPNSRFISDFCVYYEYAIRFRKRIITLELQTAQVSTNNLKFHIYVVPESCMDFTNVERKRGWEYLAQSHTTPQFIFILPCI